MKKTVYVLCNPKDKNIEGAREYGNLRAILTPRDFRGATLDDLAEKVAKELANIQEHDSLLLTGPAHVAAIASALVADILDGILPLLIWDGRKLTYRREEVVLWTRA